MGFLRAPLEAVVHGLVAWRREIHGAARAERLIGSLRDHVSKLEPLTGGVRPRELAAATANPDWTAVFDCGVQGGDPSSTLGYLPRAFQVQAAVVVSIPDSPGGPERPRRFGARQFGLFSPISTDFLNCIRTLSLVRDGERWRFDAIGTTQDFEHVDAYKRGRITDRFTSEIFVEYAAALGLNPFDESFFQGHVY